MKLKRLLSLVNETEGILQKYKDVYDIKEFTSLDELKKYIEEIERYSQLYEEMIQIEKKIHDFKMSFSQEQKDEINALIHKFDVIKDKEYVRLADCLFIGATDESIAWVNSIHLAVIGYENPAILGQTLSNVEMIVLGFEEVDAEFLKRAWQRYHSLPWTIAVTERCIIRELTLDDMDALFALYRDKELTKFTEALFEREEEIDYQRAYINNMYRYFGYGMWLVFHKETGELIGRAGLEHREYGEELELELGYLIGTNYQRQGYATEVCKAIIAYAKDEVGALALNCLIEEENIASIALAKKLGFSFCEYFKRGTNSEMLHFRTVFNERTNNS